MGNDILSNAKEVCKYAASNESIFLNSRIFRNKKDIRSEFQRDRDRINPYIRS